MAQCRARLKKQKAELNFLVNPFQTNHLQPCSVASDRWAKGMKNEENSAFVHKALVNQSVVPFGLIASFRKAQTDAAHKFGLIKAAAKKGPTAIQKAVDTADKAARRRDSFAKKLVALGVDVKD